MTITEQVEASVRSRGGKTTVPCIADDTGLTGNAIHSAIRRLGFVKVRPAGAAHYDPAIIYHPDMSPYIEDRAEPNIDTWVRGLYAEGVKTLASKSLYALGANAGYTRSGIESALKRLRCDAELVKGEWRRHRPRPLRSAADQRIIVAVLDQLSTPLPESDLVSLALDALAVPADHPAVRTTFYPVLTSMWAAGLLCDEMNDMIGRGPAALELGYVPSMPPEGVEG